MLSSVILLSAMVTLRADDSSAPQPEPLPAKYRVASLRNKEWYEVGGDRVLVGSRWVVFPVHRVDTNTDGGVVCVEFPKGAVVFLPCPNDGKLWRMDLIPLDDVTCGIALHPQRLDLKATDAMLWEWNLEKGKVSATTQQLGTGLSVFTAVDRSANSIAWSSVENHDSADRLTITNRESGRKYEVRCSDLAYEAVSGVAVGAQGTRFVPGSEPNQLIVCESDGDSQTFSLTSVDLRGGDADQWSLRGTSLRDLLGFTPESMLPLLGQTRPCKRFAVAVEPTQWDTAWGVLVVDAKTAKPADFFRLGQRSNNPGLFPGYNPVISRNGRYVVFHESTVHLEAQDQPNSMAC